MGESWICDKRLFLPPILPKLAPDLPAPLSELRLRSSALLPLRSPTYACPFCSIFPRSKVAPFSLYLISKVAPFVLFFICQKLPLLFSFSYVKSCFFAFFHSNEGKYSMFLLQQRLLVILSGQTCFQALLFFVCNWANFGAGSTCVMTRKIEGKDEEAA